MWQPPNYNGLIDDLHQICKEHMKDPSALERSEKLIELLRRGNVKLCRLAKAIAARVCEEPPQSDCDDIHIEPNPPGGEIQGDCDDIRTEPDAMEGGIQGDCDDIHTEPDAMGSKA